MPEQPVSPENLHDEQPATVALPSTVPDSAPIARDTELGSADIPSCPTARHDAVGPPEVGQRLGDFQLLTELGRGAFARVFLARQISLDREVALKVSANRGEEARALARLEHDSIVRVYDEKVDWQHNLRLVWMQFVAGTSLERIIARLADKAPAERNGRAILDAIASASPRPLALDLGGLLERQRLEECDFAEAVCWLGQRLAEALAHAHGRGVLHRDIKPANILVGPNGRPLLADFNLAAQPHQGTEGVGGTLAYMAPEHLAAFAGTAPLGVVDARSDVYSLGVVLFELLTGRHPFERWPTDLPAAELLRVLEGERRASVPSPRQVCPEVPVALDRLVRRCLAPVPEQRYSSAAELAQALSGCLELCRVEKQMPPTGPLARAVLRYPASLPVILVLLPHILGAAVDLSYNALWLASSPDGQRLVFPFVCLALAYSAIAFLSTGWMAYRMSWPIYSTVRRLQQGEHLDEETVAATRRWAVRTPLWAMVLSAAGWIPGGLMMPWLLGVLVEPVGWDLVLHFGLSFTLAGLIALTYNAVVCQFLVLQVGYPRLWVETLTFRRTAREELRGLTEQLRLMPLLAGLIPLGAGAAALVGLMAVGPGQSGTASYLTFQVLVLLLIGFGMFGCWVAASISRRLVQALSALLGS